MDYVGNQFSVYYNSDLIRFTLNDDSGLSLFIGTVSEQIDHLRPSLSKLKMNNAQPFTMNNPITISLPSDPIVVFSK